MKGSRRPRWFALALLTVVTPALADEDQATSLIVGFSNNSVTHTIASLLQGPLAAALGKPVEIRSLTGDHGFRGALATHAAAPDGDTLLIADTLTMSLNETTGARPFSISELTPLAKLTNGISVALVVREDSTIEDWNGLLAQAEERPLSLSVSGRGTAYGVAWSMIERETGLSFEHVLGIGNGHILDDVAEGRADLGIVTTNTIPMFNAVQTDKLRPIATFGAERSARYPDTPTFAELTGDDENDFTYSFAIFGPPGIPSDVVERLDAALRQALDDPRTIDDAAAIGVPLVFNDADVVRQTVERDLRVAKGVADHLR